MTWILITLAAIAIGAVLCWNLIKVGNAKMRARHAAFEPKDVESALMNVISEEPCYHDEFDLFLGHPIDDPFLESIRKRAFEIVQNDSVPSAGDISPGAAEEIEELIATVRSRM
jgi:hypothetical protein